MSEPTNRDGGLRQKFTVEPVGDPKGKHAQCRYFVLDPQHDTIARRALRHYSLVARANGYFALANDLDLWVESTLVGREDAESVPSTPTTPSAPTEVCPNLASDNACECTYGGAPTPAPSDQARRDQRADDKVRDRIARVLYEEHFVRTDDDWPSTTDGSPNSASYALADRILASSAPSTASEGATEPIHGDDCESWGCTHCVVCGAGVLYGSRCPAHPMPGSSGADAPTLTGSPEELVAETDAEREERLMAEADTHDSLHADLATEISHLSTAYRDARIVLADGTENRIGDILARLSVLLSEHKFAMSDQAPAEKEPQGQHHRQHLRVEALRAALDLNPTGGSTSRLIGDAAAVYNFLVTGQA